MAYILCQGRKWRAGMTREALVWRRGSRIKSAVLCLYVVLSHPLFLYFILFSIAHLLAPSPEPFVYNTSSANPQTLTIYGCFALVLRISLLASKRATSVRCPTQRLQTTPNPLSTTCIHNITSCDVPIAPNLSHRQIRRPISIKAQRGPNQSLPRTQESPNSHPCPGTSTTATTTTITSPTRHDRPPCRPTPSRPRR